MAITRLEDTDPNAAREALAEARVDSFRWDSEEAVHYEVAPRGEAGSCTSP